MPETEKLTAKEIEKYIRENLYKKENVAWATKENKRQITDEAGKQIEFLEPSLNAMLLMAKYYELKYGIKIIVVGKTDDLDAIKNLVDESRQSSAPCKFGFILPNAVVKKNGFLSDIGWYSSMPFSDLDGKLIYEEGHVCPVIYEKLPDGRSSIIALDSIGMVGEVSGGHRQIIEKIAGSPSIPIYENNIALQRSTKGCRDLAILMIKDALRIPHLVDKLGLKPRQSSFSNGSFDILPEQLLKYLQTGAPWKTADKATPILRPSLEKPSQTLEEYNNRHKSIIHLGNEEILLPNRWTETRNLLTSQSTENTKLLEANELMVGRIVKLCEFYGVDSEESIRNLIDEISRTQVELSKELPEKLPEWSRALEWKVEEESQPLETSAFVGASCDDQYNYQYLCFVAKNLQSTSEPKRNSAQIILDPFANQVGKFCSQLIDRYLKGRMSGLCEMIETMSDDIEGQTKFIEAFNERFEANLTSQDFKYSDSGKLKEVLKSLDFSQENDPLKELIIKCNISDDYPGSFEKQVENLCRAVAKELASGKDEDDRSFDKMMLERFFIKKVNAKLTEINGAENLELEDFKDLGSEKLKTALRLLNYDGEDSSIEKFLSEHGQNDVLRHYKKCYPLEVYQSALNDLNFIANLDKNTYEKITKNQEVELEEKEAIDIVRVISHNREMATDDSIFENKKKVRERYREIRTTTSFFNVDSIGLVEKLSYKSMKSCLDMAYKANNQEVMKLLCEEVIPAEEMMLILEKKGGSSKAAEIYGGYFQDYYQKHQTPSANPKSLNEDPETLISGNSLENNKSLS